MPDSADLIVACRVAMQVSVYLSGGLAAEEDAAHSAITLFVLGCRAPL